MLEQAKGQAIKYLTIRMRSEQEMREYLEKKGYSFEIISEVLTFLYQYNYLDDENYCRCWIADRLLLNPCGRQKMAYELSKRGVADQTAEQALANYYPEEEEKEQAKKLVNKKFSSHAPHAKIGSYLYRKGFSTDIIEYIFHEF